jgi:hypothetical protein
MFPSSILTMLASSSISMTKRSHKTWHCFVGLVFIEWWYGTLWKWHVHCKLRYVSGCVFVPILNLKWGRMVWTETALELREHLGSPSFLSKEVRVVHLFNFLSCVTFSFGPRSMSCVSNVSNVSRFFNLLCSKLIKNLNLFRNKRSLYLNMYPLHLLIRTCRDQN